MPVLPPRDGDIGPTGWVAPGAALAGTAIGALAADSCVGGIALPASGLALILTGAALWIAGVPRDRRDLITLSVAVALALLMMAALQQLLACILNRAGMASVELLQASGLLLLVLAITAEVDRRRRARAAAAAVSVERRRLARELHDGVAQELAYIRIQSRQLAGGEKLVEAADRALEESRAAISGLVRAADEPLARAIEAAAISLGQRHGMSVVCDLSADVEVDDTTRDALLRILREALVNAAKHGNASSVRIELRAGPRLSVIDDGRGFDPSGIFRPDSLGLASMRERTETLGGRFALRSMPDTGTCVEVALP